MRFDDLLGLGDIIAGGEQEAKVIDLDVVYQPLSNWQIVAIQAKTCTALKTEMVLLAALK